MKYVNMLVIFAALVWSYHASQDNSLVTNQMHQMIQAELSNLISEYVASHLPDAPKVHFKNMWTEMITPKTIKAHFEYSFESKGHEENLAKTDLEGTAVLNPDAQKPLGEGWVLQSIQILNESIEYKDGILITPNKKSTSKE